MNYVANIVSYVAGLTATLDEKVALTNYTVALKQLPGLVYTPGQLDSLTQAKINVLKAKGQGKNPALLHDQTAATDASDYTQVLRQRIKGLVIATMLAIGDPFVGSSSLDGLQLTALKTALDGGLSDLSKRGYVSNPSVRISTRPGLSVLPDTKPLARGRGRPGSPPGLGAASAARRHGQDSGASCHFSRSTLR